MFIALKPISFTNLIRFGSHRWSQLGTRCETYFEHTLKVAAKKPMVKALVRLNNAAERCLKIKMRALHKIEQTNFCKIVGSALERLMRFVKKDGLNFTILLTVLGYSAWCFFI